MAAGTTTRMGMDKRLLDVLLPGRTSDSEIADYQRKQERKPFCALLPSPELLSIGSSPGSDESNTLTDYYSFYKWAKHENLLPLEFTNKSKTGGRQLEKGEYNSMIITAFQRAFDPVRNAIQPEGSQLVLWYYAGHGVDESIRHQHYSATPLLKMNVWDGTSIYQRSDYICERAKGGELFLHHVGFCNLRALIQPWIVAVEADSFNARGQQKKNKHLVVILDSCHSGEQVNDLEKMKREEEDLPWNTHEGCSVTVQSSCRSDETVGGGYFTPLFLHLNSTENQGQLQELEDKWRVLSDNEKDAYKNLPGSSPTVSTTLPQSTDVPVFKSPKTEQQRFALNLFPDPGFFKFCHVKIFGPNEVADVERSQVSNQLAEEFLQKSNGVFRVVDYKLKTDSHGKPLGLFLLEDTNNRLSHFRFGAHIHYSPSNAQVGKVQCINLVHHHKNYPYSTDIDEDIRERFNLGKVTVYGEGINVPHALQMADACKDYVCNNEACDWSWDNLSNWRMKESYVTTRSRYLRTRHFTDSLSSLDIPKIDWCENA